MHIICRHCRCGSMEALPGIHHCKSDCNLFIMDPTWTSFLINLTLPLQTRKLLPWGFYVALRYSFIFSFFGNPLLSTLSKLCYVNMPFLISSCAALLTISYFTSAAMICFYSYVVLAGGNPPPKKAKAAA